MQTLRVFFKTWDGWFADTARSQIAKWLDGVQPGLVATAMNYEPGSNRTRTGFPVVQFFGSQSGFGLYGFGAEGAEAVKDLTPILHARMAKQGRIVQVSSSVLNNSAEWRPYAMRYCVPRMVVQKHHRHAKMLEQPETGKAHIERLFVDSLTRQAEAMGVALPKNLHVEFAGARDDFGARVKLGNPLALFGLQNALFDVNVRLGGIWAVGYQLGKGYGHFNATSQLAGTFVEVSDALSE